jgi:hypothetical protein
MTRNGFHPDAIDRNIAPGSNDPAITPVGTVWHIAVSMSDSIRSGFTDGRGIESHFYVRLDGKFEQYRSIWFEADAQAKGNSFTYDGKLCGFVSLEFEGLAAGKYTDAQVETGLMITEWVHSKSAFPRRLCPAWNLPGIGYHRLFDQWNPNSHSCPGDDRVLQFHKEILPKFINGGRTAMPTTKVGQVRHDLIARCNKALLDIPAKRVFARARIQATKLVAKTIPKS